MARQRKHTGSDALSESELLRLITSLSDLDIEGLRAFWQQHMSAKPPNTRSASLLRMELAWALQVGRFGDIDAATHARLRAVARADDSGKRRSRSKLLPGTVLVREWRGVSYRVEVLTKGFEFQGRHYRSLSEIAREISGAHWSGPRFFKLSESPTGLWTRQR